MKINRRETLSFSLAVIINILIVILIPKYEIKDVVDKKLKVGLVAFEKQKVTQKKTRVEKKVHKPKKKVNPKKKSLALSSLSKTIETPEFVNLKTVAEKQRKLNEIEVLDSIKSVKNEVKFEKENKLSLGTKDMKFSDTMDENEIKNTKNDKLVIDNEKKLSESIMVPNAKIEGLPSGYKLGVEDGDIIAKWEKSNQEPVYPESAELKGLQGTVRVKIDVNERGDVTNLVMIKGSGVPEINSAIESIGRTWKIYLSKHGLSIKGRVILDYTFKLKGGA